MGLHRTGMLLAAALALLASGCGESSSESAPDRPERIVSLSPSATETLFALGAGDQVVAVDDESDYPAGVPRTDLSAYQPNVEAIASYRPDLVIVPSTLPADAFAGLRKLGLKVFTEAPPADLEDAYREMRQLGVATGRPESGRRLARDVRAKVERLVAAAPAGRSLDVFHELDTELYSASSKTFIGQVYKRLGLGNVADAAARRGGSPYPQMSSEAVVTADPDMVVLADSECCGQTPAKVAKRPGWDEVSAVRGDAVVSIDDDVASRWGPRTPTFVARVVDAMKLARARAGAER